MKNYQISYIMIGKIAQGKYTRAEYGALVTASQAQQLKTMALEALVKLVKSLVQFTQDFQIKIDNPLKVKRALSNEEEKEKEKETETEKDAEDKEGAIDVNAEALNNMDE